MILAPFVAGPALGFAWGVCGFPEGFSTALNADDSIYPERGGAWPCGVDIEVAGLLMRVEDGNLQSSRMPVYALGSNYICCQREPAS